MKGGCCYEGWLLWNVLPGISRDQSGWCLHITVEIFWLRSRLIWPTFCSQVQDHVLHWSSPVWQVQVWLISRQYYWMQYTKLSGSQRCAFILFCKYSAWGSWIFCVQLELCCCRGSMSSLQSCHSGFSQLSLTSNSAHSCALPSLWPSWWTTSSV